MIDVLSALKTKSFFSVNIKYSLLCIKYITDIKSITYTCMLKQNQFPFM